MFRRYEGQLPTFSSEHYERLATKLAELTTGEATLYEDDDAMYISVSSVVPIWVRISKEGTIEIGSPEV